MVDSDENKLHLRYCLGNVTRLKHTNTLCEKNTEFLITFELDYDVMKTEECNVMVIGTTEQMTLYTR
jgi:hypothetical protein